MLGVFLYFSLGFLEFVDFGVDRLKPFSVVGSVVFAPGQIRDFL
jgi:hypothetical protein